MWRCWPPPDPRAGETAYAARAPRLRLPPFIFFGCSTTTSRSLISVLNFGILIENPRSFWCPECIKRISGQAGLPHSPFGLDCSIWVKKRSHLTPTNLSTVSISNLSEADPRRQPRSRRSSKSTASQLSVALPAAGSIAEPTSRREKTTTTTTTPADEGVLGRRRGSSSSSGSSDSNGGSSGGSGNCVAVTEDTVTVASPPPHDKKLHHIERAAAETQKRRKKSQSDTIHADDMDEEDLALFHLVVEDLRIKSTVGWQNAVKSMNAALSHIDRDESQQFLELAFNRVVGIMLDQHSSKIGPMEKSCVTQTLSTAIPLIVAQLKSGRYAQALPVLVMVFNKKRTFYKDLRTAAMMGSYWNKAGGAPEVRNQCIAAFCELKGFDVLLDTLEVVMKGLVNRKEDANGGANGTATDDATSMDLMDSDDIRILLQALLECHNSVPDDVTSRLCTLVMIYFVRVPDALLKREPTEAISAVVVIIRRFVDAGAVDASTINQLWLDLTLRYVKSPSLPLRLFGLEQTGQIANCARASRPFPPRYLVRNAGTPAVNGVYTLKQESGTATYVLQREDTEQVFTLFCCTMKSGLKWWFISEADKMQPGSDQDIDYYQHQSQFEECLPPMTNWMAIGKGDAPAPDLIPERVEESDSDAEMNATRFDHVLGAWVTEKEIIETIFGDRIHREVVSRSAQLVKFLAEVNKLSESAVDTIWTASLQKDRALVDEIHGLLIATLPFLSDHLVLHIIELISRTAGKRYEQQESPVELLAFLDRLATASPGFFLERSADIANTMLRLLWTLARRTSMGVVEDNNRYRLSPRLREFFQEGLRSDSGEELRREFLDECVVGIKHSSEPGHSDGDIASSSTLELLKFLIDSYGYELPIVVETLNREHALVALLFDEVAAFVNRSRANALEDTYRTAIGHRLELIHYIHLKCPVLELTVDHIQRLWTTLSSPVERECCLAFLSQSVSKLGPSSPSSQEGPEDNQTMMISSAFTIDVRRFIFDELLCQQTDFKTLGPIGYRCFHSYFVDINAHVDQLRDAQGSLQVQDVVGLDTLWKIAFEASVEVANSASSELLRVYRGMCSRGDLTEAAECVRDFLHRVSSQLAIVSNDSVESLRNVQQSTVLLNGFLDAAMSDRSDGSRQPATVSHGRRGRGAIFDVKVIAQRIPSAGGGAVSSGATQENAFRTLRTRIYANLTLGQLRKQVEQLVTHPIQQIKILCAGAALAGDHKTMSELRISESSELRVLMFNSIVPQRPLSPDADQLMEGGQTEDTADLSIGRLISEDEEYFDVFFRVLDVVAGHPAVHKALWDLLNKLPTSATVLHRVKTIGTQDAEGDTPMEIESDTTCKQELLTLLGDASQNKPIYILQVVDSLLLPADSTALPFAEEFKAQFLARGGFEGVLGYFLDADVSSSLFNEGAAVALRILRTCLLDSLDTESDSEELGVRELPEGVRSTVIKTEDYVRLALKIADLVAAEYYPSTEHSFEHTATESERILIDALKTVTLIVKIEPSAATAYIKSASLEADLMADLLLQCANEQVREQWLQSLQAVCRVESNVVKVSSAPRESVVVVFERTIASVAKIEDVGVPCDQYFRLLRFLVPEDKMASYCTRLARAILAKLRDGFSAKFLGNNEYVSEVLSGCLEFLRDVLVHQVALRAELAREIVEVVYDDCLFTLPATDRRRAPLCVSNETRRPAFKLLATAISSHAPIIHELRHRLARLFTRSTGSKHVRWGQESSMEPRRNGEYVGLKNQGCSCYMNSFLQQIFMHPVLRSGLLAAEVAPRTTPMEPTKAEAEQHPERLVGCRIALECMNGRVYEASVLGYDSASRRHRIQYDDGTEVNFVLSEGRPGSENGRYAILQTELTGMDGTLEVLRQVQRTFSYLQDSEMRYFNPKALVDACKCLNLEFSVYQQNDASEFCDKLLDRLETGLKTTPQGAKCLTHAFGGKLISQKLPHDCGHRYEREEPFIRLELQIRGKESIEESLASFVEGEVMDGDNKVECELCGTKKAAVRRTCFGALPNFLILHLKRFDLDFTTFETVKLNNRCAFPLTLDMKPYTKKGLEEREATARSNNAKSVVRSNEDGQEDEDVVMKETEDAVSASASSTAGASDHACEYRLKGILVHSGVAQGGHYYSFIYDHVSNKWFKYDDEIVSPFDPANIEAECFGGVQRRTWHGASSSMEMEVFSNALMLFYEKIEPTDTEYAASLLANYAKLPQQYEAEVWKTNEAFLQNSYVLDIEFHEFLREMVHSRYLKSQQVPQAVEPSDEALSLPPAPPSTGSDKAIQTVLAFVGVEFVMNVLLQSREKHGIARWITVLAAKFAKYKSICVQFFESMVAPAKQAEWTRAILFDSSDSIARQSFVHLTSRALTAYENHMRTAGSPLPEDVELLHKFMDMIIALLDETPVAQQAHLEEIFMLIRNGADISSTLREYMRARDMIARFVNCFLGDRAPSDLKTAFHASHVHATTIRYASPDFQYLLEAIVALLGFPRRTTEPLVNDSNTHYPHRATLSEKAEQALTTVFEQYQNAERQAISADELKRYLSVCMSCSISTPAVQHKAHGILAKYGKQNTSPSSAPSSTPTELELDGFLTYYTDAAAAAAKNVYQDLRAHGFGEDLQRRGERSASLSADARLGLRGLSTLSQSALLNEMFFDSALEEDAETVGDMLLRIVDGERNASGLLLRSLLQCMASTETGWKGQPVVDACALMLHTLLSRTCDYQVEMIELAMVHPEFGLLTTAENRERVRQRYANSNLVPLFVSRQIGVLVELHSKIPYVAAWLQEHRRLWEWMYEWLRLESLRPALGGRLSVLYREASKLETLCRVGEALGIPYREEERSYIVEGAGTESVNGIYKSTPQLHDNCTIYTCAKDDIEYTLFRCSMPSKARRWYISYSPNRALLGTVTDEDYYFVQCHFDDDSPPETGWRVWTKNEKALPGAPTVRLYASTVSLDGHTTTHGDGTGENGLSGDADCGEGDMDADADTVEYDDSEDEIRVSNERFQAVHLDNQDEGERSSNPHGFGTDEFM